MLYLHDALPISVQTEDHPLEYLEFEGTIPKGEYGGGDMWIFASGTWHALKEKTRGLYFRLESTELSGEYRIYQTGDKEWLLEKLEERSEEHTTELQSRSQLVCRLLLEKKQKQK